MEGKGRGLGRAVRRGVALGLTGAALWCMSWAADLTGWLGRAKAAGEEPAVAVALLSSQLEGGARTDKLSGWGRLLLEQSALLRAGVGSAADRPGGAPGALLRRRARGGPGGAPAVPPGG